VHHLTGLHCPGCGTLRCLHALLHGDLRQAAAFNIAPLLFGLVCGLAVVGRRIRPVTRRPRRLTGWIALWCIVLYGILRNLDLWPFLYLAPHHLQ
jgi:hypothetical protein